MQESEVGGVGEEEKTQRTKRGTTGENKGRDIAWGGCANELEGALDMPWGGCAN